MCQVAEVQETQNSEVWMRKICAELFKTWLVELTNEEKEIWLWNALVEMARIKQRRKT